MYLAILVQRYQASQVVARQIPVTPIQQHFSSCISISTSHSDHDSPIVLDNPKVPLYIYIQFHTQRHCFSLLCTDGGYNRQDKKICERQKINRYLYLSWSTHVSANHLEPQGDLIPGEGSHELAREEGPCRTAREKRWLEKRSLESEQSSANNGKKFVDVYDVQVTDTSKPLTGTVTYWHILGQLRW